MIPTTQQPEGRKQWLPTWRLSRMICGHCGLVQPEHISHIYCPEWRLRQMDGDR